MQEQMDNRKKMDMAADAEPTTCENDYDFATLIIWHHQSEIDNASAFLHLSENPNGKQHYFCSK